MYLRHITLMCLFSLLLSCGLGVESKKAPSLTLVNSSPASGDISISTNIYNLEIRVEEALNPASINHETVQLILDPSTSHLENDYSPHQFSSPKEIIDPTLPVRGDIWLDTQSNTIHFDPRKPLQQGKKYIFRVQDVRLADNRSVNSVAQDGSSITPTIEIMFSTAHTHLIESAYFDKAGEQIAHTNFTIVNQQRILEERYNESAELSSSIAYGQTFPGVNNLTNIQIYKTGLGEIFEYRADYLENGNIIAHIRARDSGIDGLWGTPDDLLQSYSDHNHVHAHHEISRNYRANTASRRAVWSGLDSPEFELNFRILTEHAGPYFQHRVILYTSVGENNVVDVDPFTQDLTVVDDKIELWFKSDYRDGFRVRQWRLKGTGVGEGEDKILFTGDDIAEKLTTFEYFPMGHELAGALKKQVNYFKSGMTSPLSSWLINSASNNNLPLVPALNYSIYEYDNNGNLSEIFIYSVGEDQLMDTNDDYLAQINTYSTQPTISGQLPLGY